MTTRKGISGIRERAAGQSTLAVAGVPSVSPLCTTPATMPPKSTSSSAPSNSVQSLLKSYNDATSPRLKLIDAFLLFLMLSGIIQFAYCILVTNFPFNAFLAGYVCIHCGLLRESNIRLSFGSSVGQFVLTASLRSQVNPANRAEFKEVSPERYALAALLVVYWYADRPIIQVHSQSSPWALLSYTSLSTTS